MSAEQYILSIDDEQVRSMMTVLRDIIFQTIPDVEEKYQWRIPMYYHNGPLCYLNPSKPHMSVGFTRGVMLPNANGLLTGDGKNVRHLIIPYDGDIPVEGFKELLQEAVELNQSLCNGAINKSVKW